jgi:phage regulator Rha-like protein
VVKNFIGETLASLRNPLYLCSPKSCNMNSLTTIQSKIHEIRGQRVMLDYDLAAMYGVETSQLKRQVRRNIERFEGDDFMFELTWDELSRCQIGTMNVKQGQNIKYLPFAFTEMGVAMLSSVLKSQQAIQINRGIMRAFVTMRHALNTMALPEKVSELERNIENLRREVDDILADQNDINESTRAQLDAISTALSELQARPPQPPRPKIGFV